VIAVPEQAPFTDPSLPVGAQPTSFLIIDASLHRVADASTDTDARCVPARLRLGPHMSDGRLATLLAADMGGAPVILRSIVVHVRVARPPMLVTSVTSDPSAPSSASAAVAPVVKHPAYHISLWADRLSDIARTVDDDDNNDDGKAVPSAHTVRSPAHVGTGPMSLVGIGQRYPQLACSVPTGTLAAIRSAARAFALRPELPVWCDDPDGSDADILAVAASVAADHS
jgi:hypothetical protein